MRPTMTENARTRRFLCDTRGVTTVEFALVATLFFTLMFGIVDFCKALWEMNSAAKAVQTGVRFAIVNDPVSNAVIFDGTAAGVPNGEPVPIGDFNGTTSCDAGTANDAAFMAIVARMQQIYDKIQPENVVIRLEHIGLGYSGNPFGSSIDPLVTVRLQGLTLNFITPGLAQLTASIPMRSFVSSQVAEDMQS